MSTSELLCKKNVPLNSQCSSQNCPHSQSIYLVPTPLNKTPVWAGVGGQKMLTWLLKRYESAIMKIELTDHSLLKNV